jgi:bifunctional N-acetylglucosamine-1-phosphate-uridyltransferase/glucosamine-1-phosphate-acetyltransferase GlmU-like protein
VQQKTGAQGTILTSVLEDQAGKGRVIRDSAGEIQEVVEDLMGDKEKPKDTEKDNNTQEAKDKEG